MSAGSAEWVAAFTAAIDTRDVEKLVPFFAPDATFTLTPISPDQPLTGVSGSLRSGPCSDAPITLTLSADGTDEGINGVVLPSRHHC